MAKVTQSTEFAKETKELGDALKGLIVSIRKKLADGFQVTDIPQALSEQFSSLITGVQGVELVLAEQKEDIQVFCETAGWTGGAVAGALLLPIEKPAPVEPAAPVV